jgi:hypothetical protein
MELTTEQAMALLGEVATKADAAREQWDAARRVRDDLIRLLDGQVGVTRAGMARVVGISRPVLYQVLDSQEQLLADVVVDPVLREAIGRAIGGDYSLGDDDGRIRIDVRA